MIVYIVLFSLLDFDRFISSPQILYSAIVNTLGLYAFVLSNINRPIKESVIISFYLLLYNLKLWFACIVLTDLV